ncbi:MAG: Gfo/Idh/MocA family oxidoreductase [Candidatus Hydrogenedentes bacterium]|nr:Gfo/Idh/MocA family oxidoreductase [Candidatus Hydrogenedentota bacterium]
MAKAMNFGVVGLGMGGHHCRSIVSAKGAHLAAVCDIDEERLARHVKDFGCKGYKRYSDMLKDPEIEAVCIVTESGKHAQMGAQAAEAGKHLIVEKPIDITPPRITKLQAAVKKAGVKCGCIFQSRMDNCNILLKRSIEKGHLGRLIGAHASLPWFRADSYFEGPHGSWKGTWKLDGGGSLMNQGIHTVDLVIFLAGAVKSVCGFYAVHNHKIEAEDQAVAILRFENGALGTLYTTTCCIPDGPQRLHFFGTKGSFIRQGGTLEVCEMGPPKVRERLLNLFGGKRKKQAVGSDPMAVSTDGHTLIIEDLVKAVRGNREPVIPLESARHAVDVACSIIKSARTGKEVQISSMRK